MSKKRTGNGVINNDMDDFETNKTVESERFEETEEKETNKEKTCENEHNKEVVEAPTKEDEELNLRYLRLAADFQNYKRRVEKEKSDIYAYANEKIVVELLNVIDDFERALAVDHSNANLGNFAEGMNMIFKQFKCVLEKNGLEEIIAVGDQFDPNFHHGILTENSVEYESGKVTQVLQKGYLINQKVIRPAMVKVAE